MCLDANRCPFAVAAAIGVVLVHPESAVLSRHACGGLTKQLFVCPDNLPVAQAALLSSCEREMYRVYRLSKTLSGLGGPKNFID